MKFIGIDLAWSSGYSGVCALVWQENQLQLVELNRLEKIAEILSWLDDFVSPCEGALIAVDAPTLIFNQTGMRLPDKLTHHYFHRYHAGCYPANLSRPFAAQTVGFGLSLEQRGFIHAPTIDPQQVGRYQIEVFPHPAMVNLFKLSKILKYKKGRLDSRKLELIKLYHYTVNQLTVYQPQLNLNQSFFDLGSRLQQSITGKELKEIEDKLDSLICAYVGAYWWYWGKDKNLILGDASTGYIIIPAPFSEMLGFVPQPNLHNKKI
ncbi:conserved hypothetical protein [Gloeothece citriformis PCC 7424]|uniref:DUF429 domain-containing protein n=1 Tax=Gloeothece citriformis (strain PCC 7424) TaxID=65393 RepID=B7KBV7_GLOC7|nr:DUF429 domain-containing protein [Gloeothece citriformis]ACK68780.1 conserved hypothetical protein [Gloeothece citriformis PCC 7424]